MNKQATPITSSLGFYCFACTILIGLNTGFNMIFGIYLLLTILFGCTTIYQIYSASKTNNDNSVTYYFFAGDRLGIGLLLATLYFDYHMSFINMNQGSIMTILLVMGIFFIISHFIKRLKKN